MGLFGKGSLATIGAIGGGIVGGPWGAAAGAALGGALGKDESSQPGAPGYNGPHFGIAKTSDFIKNDAAPQIGGPDGGGAINRRFQAIRESTSQQSNAQSQQNSDAIARKFASLGSNGSGAEIKLQQQAADQNEQNKQKALSDVNQQETDAFQNRDLQQADMDFKQKVFNFESGSKMHELNLSERQQQISQAENEYGAKMNSFINAPPKKGLISSVLDGIL